MNIFFDTEFHDDGNNVELISIGLVSETGHTYYAENAEYDRSRATDWLKDNVIPHLGNNPKPLKQIRHEIIYWIQKELNNFHYDTINFWAFFSTWDWYLFVRTVSSNGLLMGLPAEYPQFCNDLQSYATFLGKPYSRFEISHTLEDHHALNDARWNKLYYDYLTIGKNK
jgi:hypothetical protein